MEPGDPAYWMLDNPAIPRTPKTIHKPGCYICEDSEFARMGLPLCTPCAACKTGHVAADDTECDSCGADAYEEHLKAQGESPTDVCQQMSLHPGPHRITVEWD